MEISIPVAIFEFYVLHDLQLVFCAHEQDKWCVVQDYLIKPNKKNIMKTKSPKLLLAAAVASAGLLLASTAGAQVISDFNGNTTGQLQGQNGSLSTGLTGTWGDSAVTTNRVVAGNLTSTYAIPQTGTAQRLTGTSTDFTNSRNYISADIPSTGTVYFSFLGKLDDTSDRVGITISSTASNVNRADAGYSVALLGGASGTTLAYRRLNDNLGTVFNTTTPLDTQFVVGQIDFDAVGSNERVRLWLNPDLSSGSLPNIADIENSDYSFNAGQVGVFIYGSGTGDHGSLDNIRFGSSLSAVAIPEPSSALLMGIGAFATLLRRNRRSSRRL